VQHHPDQQERQIDDIQRQRIQRLWRSHEVAHQEGTAERDDEPREDG
jgi:hypothetical protein